MDQRKGLDLCNSWNLSVEGGGKSGKIFENFIPKMSEHISIYVMCMFSIDNIPSARRLQNQRAITQKKKTAIRYYDRKKPVILQVVAYSIDLGAALVQEG